MTLSCTILEFMTSQAKLLVGASEDDARPCLEAVGFTEELMSKTVTELSGGWRMRLAIARGRAAHISTSQRNRSHHFVTIL